ncbi:MAG TPA: amidohydrolase family protein [Candidatus Limnocylindria bacterium]|nr:amidohydrolase family protein [Candidatus Limnocylindria bacterium]
MAVTGLRMSGAMPRAIVCDQLLDGTGRDPVRDAVLLIEGDTITAAGPRADIAIPDRAEVLDWSGSTAMPGLIDCHEHLGLDLGDEEGQAEQPIEYTVARCVRTARKIIGSGITTIRDCGERGIVGQVMKRAVDDGVVPGPRVLAAGRNICRTGGHGWKMGREADGPDALRQAVRLNVREGADVIKIMASGGISTFGSTVMTPEFTDDEFHAVIDEGHRRGRKVAAHGHGGPGVAAAVRAGVDSIEHGLFLTMDDVRLMVEHGTFLVVTAKSFYVIRESPAVPQFQKDKVGNAIDTHREMLGRTVGSGLKVAVGTDECHGQLWFEMQLLREVGYDPLTVVSIATSSGAELLGLADRLGTLEAGKTADVIRVPADPLADFAALRGVSAVLKAGVAQPLDGRDLEW